MRDRKWLVKFLALAALTMATTSPLFAAGDGAFTRISMLLDSRLPNTASPVPVTRVESGACACNGVVFSVACRGGEKAICRCNPPGFKCAK
jgi:hypothetical protein